MKQLATAHEHHWQTRCLAANRLINRPLNIPGRDPTKTKQRMSQMPHWERVHNSKSEKPESTGNRNLVIAPKAKIGTWSQSR